MPRTAPARVPAQQAAARYTPGTCGNALDEVFTGVGYPAHGR